MLYFWKAKGPRTSKMIFWTVRYTNTQIQIHKYSIWQNDRNTQHMLYFWTAGGSRMSKMIISSILIRDTQLTFARSHQVYFKLRSNFRSLSKLHYFNITITILFKCFIEKTFLSTRIYFSRIDIHLFYRGSCTQNVHSI